MATNHLRGIVDLHSHVLPGIDDGAPDIAAALAIARRAIEEGIATLVATPHTLDGVFDVERERAFAAHAELRVALASAGLAIDVRVAAEVRFHETIPARLATDPTLTLDGKGRYLLLELPHESAPAGLPDLIFRLKVAGTTPVIAHPERNRAVRADPTIVAEWLRLGAKLQVTAGSITGAFGEPIRACAEHLLKAGHVHLIATDTHSIQKRPPCIQAAILAAEPVVGEDGARLLALENPIRILEGGPAEHVVPARSRKRRGWFAALRW